MVQERRILYEHLDVPDINTFDVFRQYDGYTRFEKAIAPNINLTKSLKW